MSEAGLINQLKEINQTLQKISRSLETIKAQASEATQESGSKSKYPHPVMKMSELKAMGFSETWLLSIYRRGRGKIAWKNSNASNSPILFDTALLEKERQAECTGGR